MLLNNLYNKCHNTSSQQRRRSLNLNIIVNKLNYMDALIAEQNRTLNAKLKVRQYMQQTGQFCHTQHNFNTQCTSNNSLV